MLLKFNTHFLSLAKACCLGSLGWCRPVKSLRMQQHRDIIKSPEFFFFSFFLKSEQHPFSHPQRFFDHSLVPSARACIVHSCSHWSSHYTGRCGWKISAATFLCHHAHCTGTGVRDGDCRPQWTRTGPFLCWSHTRPLEHPWGTGSIGRSAAPRGWRTPGEIVPVRGWHIRSPLRDPLSKC